MTPATVGRYAIVSRLDQSGMGSLYLARDPGNGRRVVVKVLRPEADSPEASLIAGLRHPNIVSLLETGEHEGVAFIAMEYIEGETLGAIITRRTPIAIARRIRWVEDLCAGLAHAHHQGVIHLDVKPANLMVAADGMLTILDVPLIRRTEGTEASPVIIGTPNYMSPEQVRGAPLDIRSDIFSVGAVMYEVLAYQAAFPGPAHLAMRKILHEEPEPLEHQVPGIDPAIVRILSRAMVKNRDDRYLDLPAMKNDLAEARARLEAVSAEAFFQ